MNYKFSILFRLIIHHSYFNGGICNCIRFSPGPLTTQLIKRFSFRYNSSNNVFAFFSRFPGETFFDYIKQTTGISHFDIELTTTDPDFHHFTELTFQQGSELVYDTNESNNYFKEGSLHLQAKAANNYAPGRLGVLKIHFDDIIKYSNKKAAANFAIDFTSRATQWQYFIINTTGSELRDPIIKKAELKFRGPKAVTTKDGQQALFFSSGGHLLSLKEYPEHRFSLFSQSEDNNSASKTIIKTLPCPRPSHFDFVEVNGIKEMASPMYVFI